MTAPLLPWENSGTLPWEVELYDRTVSVRRLRTVAAVGTGVGNVGYSGAEQSTTSTEGETILFTGLSATIQSKSSGKLQGKVPGDVAYKPEWMIDIPVSQNAIVQYDIRDRDIIQDDEGYRYGVLMNRWVQMFGYHLTCVRLEA